MPYTCFQETHIPFHTIVTVSTQINRKSPASNIRTHSNSATRILHSHGYIFKQCCSIPKAIFFLFHCSSFCLFWVRVEREKESNKTNVSANKPNFGAWMIEFYSMPETRTELLCIFAKFALLKYPNVFSIPSKSIPPPRWIFGSILQRLGREA